MSSTIAFIGGGNMARSLIGGLIARGRAADEMIVSDPLPNQLEALRAAFGVRTAASNVEAATQARVVILAVKPQDLRSVLKEIEAVLRTRQPLVISIAAGIRASDIERWAGGVPVVRCMPNRPALQGCGMTSLYTSTWCGISPGSCNRTRRAPSRSISLGSTRSIASASRSA